MSEENYLTLTTDKFVKHMRQERLSRRTIKMYVWVINQIAKIDTRLYRLSNETGNEADDYLVGWMLIALKK